jgi:hypothetical protein
MRWLIPLIGAAGAAALTGCVAYTPYGTDAYYSGGRYYSGTYVDGRAYRDRDRDGIPNRYDRDRDNDGVPNRYDRAPNDPRRY